MEEIVMGKHLEEWEEIERICYDESNHMPSKASFEKCMEWKDQILHLRVTGKSIHKEDADDIENYITVRNGRAESSNYNSRRSSFLQEASDFSNRQLHKRMYKDIINALLVYVSRELFPIGTDDGKYHNNNSLITDTFPRKSIGKSHIQNEDLNFVEPQDAFARFNDHAYTNNQQKKPKKVIQENGTIFNGRLPKPAIGRNKLGTVFNERIIVSPVPYVVSTRESFSTLKTTPIKVSDNSLDAFTSRDISRMSHLRSTWQNPVRPTVWPKNLRLAPINASQIPNDFNRIPVPSTSIPQRNRRALSPITRSVTPLSAHSMYSKNGEKSFNYEGSLTRQSEHNRLKFERSHSGNQSTKKAGGK